MGKEVEGASSTSAAGSDLWTAAAPGTCPAEASRNAPQTSQYLQLTQESGECEHSVGSSGSHKALRFT